MYYFGYFTCLISVLLYLIQYTYHELTPVDPKCSDPITKKFRCCTGHRTSRGKCYPCIDSFGFECIKSCPEGYHGLKCLEKCRCNTTQYNVGCKTTGPCFDATNRIICIGGTGHDCSIPCPRGYYGEECKEKCMCEGCDRKTGVCTDRKTTGISLVSLAILAVAGILFVATCVVCVLMKRRLSLNVHLNYQEESICPNDLTSQSYAKVYKNVYNECEAPSPESTASTKNSCERHYNTYDVPNEDVQKTAKPSILALLLRKKDSEARITKSEYIHVIETQGPLSEPTSVGSVQSPSLPPQTSSQVETSASNSKKLSCTNMQQRITNFENQHKND